MFLNKGVLCLFTVQRQLEHVKEHLRFARDFGCSIVGTETGTVTPDFSYHPDTHSAKGFKLILKSVAELVGEAEKFGVFVGIEGVTKHSVSTPEKMARVIETIKSNNLQVILDPCNFISEDNYERQEEIIKQSFDLFGDRIQILHAKDFIIENRKKKIVLIGEGLLNYEEITPFGVGIVVILFYQKDDLLCIFPYNNFTLCFEKAKPCLKVRLRLTCIYTCLVSCRHLKVSPEARLWLFPIC